MFKKILKCLIIFALVIFWIFSGYPVIWQNPRIPPEILKTKAATEDRQNYYAESTGESTTTNTSYQDKTTLTFTPDDNSTYVIVASWLMRESSTSYQVLAKLTRTTGTAKDFNELIYQPKDASDYISGGAVAIDTFGSSPGSQTYKIQYMTNNASGTAGIKEAKIIAIKLTNLDKYAEVEARTQTALTAYQDKTTLTFTPETAGDYIILASATGDGESASYDFRIQLNVDGTAYSNYNIEPAYINNRYLWGMVKRVNLAASSHTIKIQYSSESTNTSREAGIAHARIVVLRADLFNNNYYSESETRVTTTSTSYQDKTTLTQTPLAQDHLIIGSAGIDGSSASYSSYGQLIKDSTSYAEMLVETKDSGNQGYPYFTIKKETLANSSTTWKVQYKTENASGTSGIKDARISVIELRQQYITVGTTGTQTSSVYNSSNNNYIGGAFTFVRSTGTANITQIIVKDTGTVNANSNLSNLKLYYETAGTCNYDGNETLFGTASSFNSSDQATVTGTLATETSQICVYAVLDVGSGASSGETIELEISNPETDITVSSGVVVGTSAVAISGTTTITQNEIISISISDGSVNYGVITASGTKNTITLSDTQIVTNDGNVTENFNIKGYNASGGGCTWSLVSGIPGNDQYKQEFSTNSGSSWTYLETDYKSLATGITSTNNINLDLQITMPSQSSCFGEQSVNITIQAVKQ